MCVPGDRRPSAEPSTETFEGTAIVNEKKSGVWHRKPAMLESGFSCHPRTRMHSRTLTLSHSHSHTEPTHTRKLGKQPKETTHQSQALWGTGEPQSRARGRCPSTERS